MCSRVGAKRRPEFRAALRHAGDVQRPLAMPFHNAAGRILANSAGIANLNHPPIEQQLRAFRGSDGQRLSRILRDTPIFAAHCRANSAAVVNLPPITEIMCSAPSAA